MAEQNRAAANTGNNERGERADAPRDDHDEHGERGEREGRRGSGPGGPGEMMRRMPLMAALDANSDGVISSDEIEKAPAALKHWIKTGMGN